MFLPDTPNWAIELLESEPVGRLALLDDDDSPRVLPVTFALHEDAIWSAIDQKPKRSAEPARLRYLRRRPEAAFEVDVYDEEWSRLRWVQLLGTVAVLEAAGNEPALDALIARYPQYRDAPPPGPLLRLDVARVLCWRATPESG